MDYLKKQHQNYKITITSFKQNFEEYLHPVKQKRKHYINKFNTELQIENPQPKQEDTQISQQISVQKLYRKKFLKKLDVYMDFLEGIKESEQQFGSQLNELDSKLLSENEINSIDKYSEERNEIIQQLTGIQLSSKLFLYLPQWKDFKKVLKQISQSHIEIASDINKVSIQLVSLRRTYTKEVEEIRKQRKKLKYQTVECYQHYNKILNEFNQIEKDLQSFTLAHQEMLKRKDDPTQIIKSEMKVKLQMQQSDTIRLKLTDARDKIKENQIEINEFNQKMHLFQLNYEESRVVFVKQGFQAFLITSENYASQFQTQISTLIVIMDEDYYQIYPSRQHRSPKSPQKQVQEDQQQNQIAEFDINEQIKECQRQTTYLLQQWQIVQKYNEELEYFFRDTIQIFNQKLIDKDFTLVKLQIELEKQEVADIFNVLFSSLVGVIQIIKDSNKQLVDQIERKRQDIAKCRLEMSIGKELETCALRDLKKLQSLSTDEKALEQYQNDQVDKSKTKKAAQHFFNEMKQNMSDVKSLNFGKFYATIGQTVSKVQKMSNLKEDDLREQQVKLIEDKKTLISLQGYTLKKIEDILNKHNKQVAKMKKTLIEDLGRFAIQIFTNLRMIVDETTENIQIMQQREILQNESKEQVIQNEKEVTICQNEEMVEDVYVSTTSLLLQKLLKVLVNDWKESQFFKGKIKKILHKTLNKKRAAMLSEINVSDLKIIGDPPSLSDIQALRQDANEFLCDLDLSFRGKVLIVLSTIFLVTWPKEYQVPIEIKITVTNFASRIRLCFVPTPLGKSWLSIIGQPAINLDIELNLLQKYNVAKIQQITDLIREALIGKVKLMTYPNTVSIKLPLSKK
ncbi:unnamed protein product (macronuclear) [Paramecium tetraurelia]|uniref:SMP-LTD domain-containing protein n=1 Tax=Paramecium tetraurelia TaxID=5888 RepID=A0D249_PARTE|nr:uncharacterized protein GSPATT00012622001 [Paramecium tetraurelia]CAK77116.1 unnamed protein product [Paramecium tetraurelia]|eukprot:XP_001444513.1 hypothetical protein (macronuclear) [Paramecium tetraurelia strain d4-2]